MKKYPYNIREERVPFITTAIIIIGNSIVNREISDDISSSFLLGWSLLSLIMLPRIIKRSEANIHPSYDIKLLLGSKILFSIFLFTMFLYLTNYI